MEDCAKISQGKRKDLLFHVIHKVPCGDSPYVRAKHVQVMKRNMPLLFPETK